MHFPQDDLEELEKAIIGDAIIGKGYDACQSSAIDLEVIRLLKPNPPTPEIIAVLEYHADNLSRHERESDDIHTPMQSIFSRMASASIYEVVHNALCNQRIAFDIKQATEKYIAENIPDGEDKNTFLYKKGQGIMVRDMGIEPEQFSWLAAAEFLQEFDRVTILARLGIDHKRFCRMGRENDPPMLTDQGAVDFESIDRRKIFMEIKRRLHNRMSAPEGERKDRYLYETQRVKELEAKYQLFLNTGIKPDPGLYRE